jgi:hypothetical protein
VSAVDLQRRTIFVADRIAATESASLCSDEKLSAFIELERQVLTVTFYLESIHADSCR